MQKNYSKVNSVANKIKEGTRAHVAMPGDNHGPATRKGGSVINPVDQGYKNQNHRPN